LSITVKRIIIKAVVAPKINPNVQSDSSFSWLDYLKNKTVKKKIEAITNIVLGCRSKEFLIKLDILLVD